MKAGQKSKRNGIEDILCPFTDIVITQGSGINGGTYSHNGTRAIDLRGINAGVRYPYYAPFKCKATLVLADYGQTVWQSLEKVRFADGTVDYCTFLTVHDDTINFGVGLVVEQGGQIGNMGTAGNATGVHCHIEFAKGLQGLIQNSYGVWGLSNAIEFEEACFMDNTNIISGIAKWIYLKDVIIEDISVFKEEINVLKLSLENSLKEALDKQKQVDEYKTIIESLNAKIEQKNEILEQEQRQIILLNNTIENLENEIDVITAELEKAKMIECNHQKYSVLFNIGKLYLCVKKEELED